MFSRANKVSVFAHRKQSYEQSNRKNINFSCVSNIICMVVGFFFPGRKQCWGSEIPYIVDAPLGKAAKVWAKDPSTPYPPSLCSRTGLLQGPTCLLEQEQMEALETSQSIRAKGWEWGRLESGFKSSLFVSIVSGPGGAEQEEVRSPRGDRKRGEGRKTSKQDRA